MKPLHTDPLAAKEIQSVISAFDAYGSHINTWPKEKAAVFNRYRDHAAVIAAHGRAQALDSLLDTATALTISDQVKNKIIASYHPPKRTAAAEYVNNIFGGFRFLPAGVLAGITAFGFAFGILTDRREYLPEMEVYALMDDTGTFSVQDEEEDIWDVE